MRICALEAFHLFPSHQTRGTETRCFCGDLLPVLTRNTRLEQTLYYDRRAVRREIGWAGRLEATNEEVKIMKEDTRSAQLVDRYLALGGRRRVVVDDNALSTRLWEDESASAAEFWRQEIATLPEERRREVLSLLPSITGETR